jgi:hypothetical protein
MFNLQICSRIVQNKLIARNQDARRHIEDDSRAWKYEALESRGLSYKDSAVAKSRMSSSGGPHYSNRVTESSHGSSAHQRQGSFSSQPVLSQTNQYGPNTLITSTSAEYSPRTRADSGSESANVVAHPRPIHTITAAQQSGSYGTPPAHRGSYYSPEQYSEMKVAQYSPQISSQSPRYPDLRSPFQPSTPNERIPTASTNSPQTSSRIRAAETNISSIMSSTTPKSHSQRKRADSGVAGVRSGRNEQYRKGHDDSDED